MPGIASGYAIGICLYLAAGYPPAPVFIETEKFTLAWNHSIEKVRWEESYQVVIDKYGNVVLKANLARIKGSGAGMEPPTEATLVNGWYVYKPNTWPTTPLRLTRSGFTDDYQLCVNGSCEIMENIIPTDKGITLLDPCLRKAIR